MDLIIDFLFLYDSNQELVIKEAAIISVQTNHVGHWILTPPYKLIELTEEVTQQNKEITENHHGLKWYDGDTCLKDFKILLSLITREVKRIFVYGFLKEKLLKELISHDNIVNLKTRKCPWIINYPNKEYMCYFHGIILQGDFNMCALTNAINLKNYILKYKDKYDIDEDKKYLEPKNLRICIF